MSPWIVTSLVTLSLSLVPVSRANVNALIEGAIFLTYVKLYPCMPV